MSGAWKTNLGAGGAVPIASGITIFAEGADTISSGLTALNVAQQQVTFTPACNIKLGSGGTSATIGVNTNGAGEYANHILYYGAGSGYAYITAGTNGIGIVKVNSGGKLYLTGGTINTRIDVVRGELDVNDQVDLSGKTLNIYGGNTVVDWKADGTDPAITLWGGTLFTRRTGGTITVNGGRLIVQVEKEANAAAALIQNGGVIDWRAGDIPTTLTLLGGLFTAENAIRPCDFSAATTTIGPLDKDSVFTGSGAKVKWATTIVPAGATGLILPTGTNTL